MITYRPFSRCCTVITCFSQTQPYSCMFSSSHFNDVCLISPAIWARIAHMDSLPRSSDTSETPLYLLSLSHWMVSLDSHDKEVHKAHLFDVLLVPVDPVGRSFDSLVCLRNGKGELSCICGSQHQDVLSLSLPHTLVLEEGLEIQRSHEIYHSGLTLTRPRSSRLVRELKPNLTT